MKKKVWGLLTALSVTAVICGCGAEKQDTSLTEVEANQPEYSACLEMVTPSAYTEIQGLSLEPGTYLSIIGKNESDAYWKEVQEGVMQAADDLNAALGYTGNSKIKVVYNAPAKSENIDEQVNILDEELARYPDVIGLASIDQDAYRVQLDLAVKNGIGLVALDSGNTYQGIQCTVKTDNSEAARTGAYKLSDEIGDGGEVLLLVHDSESEASQERAASFLAEISANSPNVSVVATVYCDTLSEVKQQIAAQRTLANPQESVTADSLSDEDVIAWYLEQYPTVKGIFGTDETTTQLALSAVQAQEKTGQVVIVGFDAGKAQIEALKNGDIAGLVVQNPFGMGYASVVAAARTALQIGNEAQVDTGYVWVTKENVDSDSIQALLYE